MLRLRRAAVRGARRQLRHHGRAAGRAGSSVHGLARPAPPPASSRRLPRTKPVEAIWRTASVPMSPSATPLPMRVVAHVGGLDIGEVGALEIGDRELAEDVVEHRGRHLDRVVALHHARRARSGCRRTPRRTPRAARRIAGRSRSRSRSCSSASGRRHLPCACRRRSRRACRPRTRRCADRPCGRRPPPSGCSPCAGSAACGARGSSARRSAR